MFFGNQFSIYLKLRLLVKLPYIQTLMFNFFGNSGAFPPGMGPLPSGMNSSDKVDTKELYQVLGVSKSASEAEIRKAYHKLAVRWHPDKNRDNKEKAEQKFKEISKAYQILSDSEKRKVYDTYGERALQDMDGASGGGDPMDLFGNIFGGSSGKRHAEEVPAIVTSLELTLNEFYHGGTFSVEVTRTVATDTRGESRPGGMVKCSSCEGQGTKTQTRQMGPGMFQQFQGACDKCQGRGFSLLDGYVASEKTEVVAVPVEPGMMEGQHVIASGKGNPDIFRPGYFGDVAVKLDCKVNAEEQNWKRQKVHLIYHKEVDIFQALTGLEFTIKHLGGDLLRIIHNTVVKPEMMKKITGLGMPYPDGTPRAGDLYILFRLKFPETVSPKQRKLLKTVRRAFSIATTTEINLPLSGGGGGGDSSSSDTAAKLINLDRLPDSNPGNRSQDDSDEDSEDGNGERVACAQQ